MDKAKELFRKLQAAEAKTAVKRAELEAAVLAEKQAFDRCREVSK